MPTRTSPFLSNGSPAVPKGGQRNGRLNEAVMMKGLTAKGPLARAAAN